jgi:MFS family permease
MRRSLVRWPTGGLWRHPDFLKLWTAQTVSQVGSQITQLGLPFAAVVVLHASALEVSLIVTAAIMPFVLFALPAGVWVDRLRRKTLMIVADFGRLAVLASIPIAYAFGALIALIRNRETVAPEADREPLARKLHPARLQGRMNAIVRFMYWSRRALGAAIGGAIASTVGLRGAMWVAAVGSTLVMVPLAFSSVRRVGALPEPAEPPERLPEARAALRVADA